MNFSTRSWAGAVVCSVLGWAWPGWIFSVAFSASIRASICRFAVSTASLPYSFFRFAASLSALSLCLKAIMVLIFEAVECGAMADTGWFG